MLFSPFPEQFHQLFSCKMGRFSVTGGPYHTEGLDPLLRTLRFVRSITTWGEDYGFVIFASGDVRHTRCNHLTRIGFPLSQSLSRGHDGNPGVIRHTLPDRFWPVFGIILRPAQIVFYPWFWRDPYECEAHHIQEQDVRAKSNSSKGFEPENQGSLKAPVMIAGVQHLGDFTDQGAAPASDWVRRWRTYRSR
jgi:hypothetical protein